MKETYELFTIREDEDLIVAEEKIDTNKKGFLIVVNDDDQVVGTLTDGDIRRFVIKTRSLDETAGNLCNRNAILYHVSGETSMIVDLFKDEEINFIPIVDEKRKLVNILTKKQLHALFLMDMAVDYTMDYHTMIDDNIVDYELFQRPWGFFKTTVLNRGYQGKIISIKPGHAISLQLHKMREEHWIIIHGEGVVQIGEHKIDAHCGNYFFIPKETKHRIANTGIDENLIFSEIQIGEYLGEDDIVRLEDEYGRAEVVQTIK